jgi:hypothetical protein
LRRSSAIPAVRCSMLGFGGCREVGCNSQRRFFQVRCDGCHGGCWCAWLCSFR